MATQLLSPYRGTLHRMTPTDGPDAGTRPTHICPGGCGRYVNNAMFACSACWRALPGDLQRPIVATAGMSLQHPTRNAAVLRACQWYGSRVPR
jgi:hypothetical protein